MPKLKSMAALALAAAAIAPTFAQSLSDISAERGTETVRQWTGQKTRAQVYQEVLQARNEGTLSYVGDQPVIRTPAFRAEAAQSMGYGSRRPQWNSTPAISHDGYRLVGDIYVKEGAR